MRGRKRRRHGFFGETHQGWLKKYLGLPNGIPSADTILRVLGRIDRRKFEACFLSWTRGYFRERTGAGSVIAIDGKTVRGSESGERKAIHIVSAWADEMALGQVQTEGKSNEITAMPALLEALDISGCIVMLDVAFREDYARNRTDHSAANLALLRKITLNLIRLEPAEKYRKQKLPLNRKRLYAS